MLMGRQRCRSGSPHGPGRGGRTGRVCDHDRWLALAGEKCLLCGRPARRAADIVDELVEVVIDEGGSIEHVSADTALKEYVVAASLRFPLPPEPHQ